MSDLQLALAAAAAALLAFWMIGARNRLVEHRNQIAEAWGKVDEAQRARAAAGATLAAGLRGPLAAEQSALDAWQAALQHSQQRAAALATAPVQREAAAAWVAAEAALAASTSRVFALADGGGHLGQDADTAAAATAWREAETRLAFARRLFNEAATAYDEAIALFPTRLLAPMFSFGPAGRL